MRSPIKSEPCWIGTPKVLHSPYTIITYSLPTINSTSEGERPNKAIDFVTAAGPCPRHTSYPRCGFLNQESALCEVTHRENKSKSYYLLNTVRIFRVDTVVCRHCRCDISHTHSDGASTATLRCHIKAYRTDRECIVG